MNATSNDKAARFRSLHEGTRPLALTNVWDVASAVVAEEAGASAVATTSAGVAWALGRPDGNQLDRARGTAVVSAIAAAVDVPVTVDVEGGYAASADGVGETVAVILDAGAVGINIEDGDRGPEELVARIVAARRAADAAGVPMFINARTDVFLAAVGSPDEQLAEALARADRYIEAGADGIFVPGASTAECIGALTAALPVPVNVMVGPGALSIDDLGRLGVARVSLGSSVAQAAYAVVQRAVEEMASSGTYGATAGAVDYGWLNDLIAGRRGNPIVGGGLSRV
ncbi:isocitrate lyase/phosphoenolpyruvate mutase family protein [Mumia sp. zg.B21]|uniref:isocitrate lyase/PEP mutase family protein n=1 Tax=Mumia sp. zg.B21 TaxID=2855447 RepID=UPI001C6F0AE3|nr:isocitrate lyase/phosphoenolpyruvate mutase family protein [Mumia sp. zg.B21]MBW9209667.1 isocitrate lyase/phosphoenolpyruvate mutase family protein [Mumia sp. zg.B21]